MPEVSALVDVLFSATKFPSNAARLEAIAAISERIRRAIHPSFSRALYAVGNENVSHLRENPNRLDRVLIPGLFSPARSDEHTE